MADIQPLWTEPKRGAEHPDSLMMVELASTHKKQRQWKEGKELETEILHEVLGAEPPDRLTRMANQALSYFNQGRWEEAEELDVQVMEMRKRVLGAEHQDTLTVTANLAATYFYQGRWK